MKLLFPCAFAVLAMAAPAFATTPTPTTATPVEAAPSLSQTQSQSQNQQQSQSQAQSTANANNAQQVVDARQYAPRNVASALAPAIINVAPCAIGAGVGVQGGTFGLSLGGSKVNRACERRANAMMLMQLNENEAAVLYLAAGDREMSDAIRLARSRPAAVAVAAPPPAPVASAAPAVAIAAAPTIVPAQAVASPAATPRRIVRAKPARARTHASRGRAPRLAALTTRDCAPGPNRLASR